ncbi:hypothetical protein [Chitinophaga polysaccharea]|uniref:hypothetical protein n=1 Tax=Chitinophaga polysaccharea TaxID=1293035 RepID=UPI001157DCCD|nr:hypothetical protein [Chitinophaga polysaccharea]
MSALIYRGTYPGIALRFSSIRPGVTQEIGFRGAAGKLHAKNGTNTLQSKVADLDYRILFAVRKTGSIQFDLGAALDNYFNLRESEQYVNNRDYYEFISSIGPVLKFKYASTKNCEVSTALFYPFASALSASYAADEGQAGLHAPSFRTMRENIRLAGWNELSRIQWNTGLKVKAHKNNSLSLNYQWEYYKVKTVLLVQSAVHHLTLNYFFLL